MLTNSKFYQNKTDKTGSIAYISGNRDTISLIKNCVFFGNTSLGNGGLILVSSALHFEDS